MPVFSLTFFILARNLKVLEKEKKQKKIRMRKNEKKIILRFCRKEKKIEGRERKKCMELFFAQDPESESVTGLQC